jgi:hypothetical protein
MALIPLNKFVTKTTFLQPGEFTPLVGGTGTISLLTSTSTVYTAPIGVTSIVLMAQISNISTITQTVNVVHHRNRQVLQDSQGNGGQSKDTDTFLVKDFAIPEGDAASVLSGKLIIESLDSVRAYITTEDASTGSLQLILSILESANN